MHEAMEQQQVSISKANVQATLRAQTAVLAAANPKFGRFLIDEPPARQVNLPPSLINRFDVLFILRDLPDRKRDESIASHVLREHMQNVVLDIIDKDLLRKYIAYAKQKYDPALTAEAVKEIKDFYVGLRNQPSIGGESNRPIPISARQLEALIRMAEATARARLSKKVTVEDARAAITLMKYYMMQLGYDEETKSFDIDKVSGMPASQRGKIAVVKTKLEELEGRLGKLIPMEEVEKELEGKITKEELDETIGKLVRAGDLFKPRRGYVQRV
jgi:replicative DNA helicase Mcm